MKIGIANATYANENYDHIKTLELAVKLKIDVVQVYLNPKNVNELALLKEVRNMAKENEIELITHLHGPKLQNGLEKVLTAHETILTNQKNKRTVVHFSKILENSKLIERLNELKIIPHIENINKGIMKQKENEKHNNFINFVLNQNENYKIGAVLDLGNYFSKDQDNIRKIEDIKSIIFNTYKRFVDEDVPVFFHTVGKKHSMERREWTYPGSNDDIIPQKEILKGILLTKETKGPLIIEAEKPEHTINGVNSLKEFLVGELK